jgi:hypothetical protein
MPRWTSASVIALIAGVLALAVTPFFADAVSAAGENPPEKQALLDNPPASSGTDVDDSAGSGNSPLRNAVVDVGSSPDLTAVKSAVLGAQTRFNQAQILSADKTTRLQQAQAISTDVQSAQSRGTDAFVSEATAAETSGQSQPAANQITTGPSDFRIKMVSVFDAAVVVDESSTLSNQLVADANSDEIPSLVQTSFSALTWQGVQVSGDTATALVLGSYANCFQGGVFPTSDCTTENPVQWQLTLHRGSDGVWRLTSRTGVDADPAVLEQEGTPPPGVTPPPDPSPTPSAPGPSPSVTASTSPSTSPSPTKKPSPTPSCYDCNGGGGA